MSLRFGQVPQGAIQQGPSLLRQVGPFLLIGTAGIAGVWFLSDFLSPSKLIGGAASGAASLIGGTTDVLGQAVVGVANTIPETVGAVAQVIPETVNALAQAGVSTIGAVFNGVFGGIGGLFGQGLPLSSTFQKTRQY